MPIFDLPHAAVSPPIVTPFAADGDAPGSEVDADALASHVDALVEAGIDGVVPCGTTGEFASLDDGERRTVIETVVDAADGRVPVIAGAADTAVSRVRDHLSAAAAAGADAGLVTLPYYHTSTDPDGQRAFLEAVADDAPLPILLYDIPATVGEGIDLDALADAASRESVIGMKDTTGDLTGLEAKVGGTPDSFAVFQGVDAQLYPSASLGVDGGIHALSQAIPEAFDALGEAIRAGDDERALALHRRAVAPLFARCADHGFAPATKVAAAHRGFIPDPAVRPPLTLPDEAAREAIRDDVDAALDVV
ncbi:dihydrodipicolinate synthase family protein [Halorubrum sp. Atlit-8R]|uniref:dihydrodipicolinate synthase family protein n=1 Tax=unclassified Halorubrum TaxID=2642239 RepID=UPI000EF1C3F5|nr:MULTISPECIES: dihydrodipicolinate synthase family protein [unclassified Halorubrum]RLM71306.1 dihydrodipicolinate synthase family protein [Halorubrum sp. Atlit-9R]RLM72174.1 dihydrodipicolinate synthase family protein [Halorubrum sp. Atlit-9R]RLM82541.1 dihydrodipicolinate synthase family protein [Halorubrum sp. Atlit-8R]